MIKGVTLFCCLLLCINIFNAQDIENIKRLNNTFKDEIWKDFSKAKRIAQKAVLESEKVKNDTLLLESYTNMSKLYLLLKVIDSSSIFCDKAMRYATQLQDFEKLAILNNVRGKLAKINSDFKVSLEFHEKALNIAKSKSLKFLEVDIGNSLALLYRSKSDKKKSFQSVEEAIKLGRLHNYKNGLAKSYNTKGLLFFDTKKDSVIYYYKEAIKMAKSSNNLYLEETVLSNLGDFYLNIGKNEEALITLKEAEYLAKKVGDHTAFYYINMSLAIYNEDLEKYNEAVKFYKKALNDNTFLLSKRQKRRVYWLLSGVLWFNKQYKEAFDYQEKYIYLNDSIFNIEKEKEFQTLKTEYEVEKKDNQIALLETEKELANTRRKWIIITSILLIIPLLILFLFYRHRARTQSIIRTQEQQIHKQEKEHLEQQQELKETQALIEGQDKERERIAKELHDGIAGQLASINLNLSHANKNINNETVTKISGTLKQTFKELRALSHDLSYNYHKDKSFHDLLVELKQKYEQLKLFAFNISVYPDNALQNLDVYIKHNLYRILQELIANVSKHANAKDVQLSFNKHDNLLIMMLEDNGLGFKEHTQKDGIGIKNIKQRVASINGTFHIESTLERGTTVIIEIPVQILKTSNKSL